MVLKDCSRCMVYTPKGQRLSEARVVHAKDSVTLFFSDYKFQDSRFQARVDFYDDQCGLIVAKCEVTIRRNPAGTQVQCGCPVGETGRGRKIRIWLQIFKADGRGRGSHTILCI